MKVAVALLALVALLASAHAATCSYAYCAALKGIPDNSKCGDKLKSSDVPDGFKYKAGNIYNRKGGKCYTVNTANSKSLDDIAEDCKKDNTCKGFSLFLANIAMNAKNPTYRLQYCYYSATLPGVKVKSSTDTRCYGVYERVGDDDDDDKDDDKDDMDDKDEDKDDQDDDKDDDKDDKDDQDDDKDDQDDQDDDKDDQDDDKDDQDDQDDDKDDQDDDEDDNDDDDDDDDDKRRSRQL